MSEIKKFELLDEELDQIAGGTAYICGNTNRIGFSTVDTIYNINTNVCTARQVRNLCEDLIGKYATEEEFDAACIAALKAKGWI